MGGGHWVLRYCGKINFWFCGILWTSAMQFFSIVDGIKDHPPNPPPFFELFPISICFRNRLEVKSTRLDVHEQILTSYFRALCSKCNIQSSGGGVCLIFFCSIAVFRPSPPPPMSPSYGSHAATFFRSPDLIILHLCFFCLKWGSGNRKNIFLSCKVDVNK